MCGWKLAKKAGEPPYYNLLTGAGTSPSLIPEEGLRFVNAAEAYPVRHSDLGLYFTRYVPGVALPIRIEIIARPSRTVSQHYLPHARMREEYPDDLLE